MPTARQLARAELTQAIKAEARRQLAEEGAPALSLRAVARSLGMVSSAIYRYFPSRDELLTALIIDAYDSVGAAAEDAGAGVAPDDLDGRWLAVCRAVRGWAVANPHQYALVYGSPIPGYAAPAATIGPASRVTFAMLAILRDAARAGRLRRAATPLDPTLEAELRAVADAAMPELDPDQVVRAIMAWTQVFGTISFELFGHLVGSVSDYERYFDEAARQTARFIGLEPPGTERSARSSRSRGRAGPTGRSAPA